MTGTTDLRALYEDRGPFASAYIDVRAGEPGRPVPRSWRPTRATLARVGAPEPVLACIDDCVAGVRPGITTLAVVASPDGVLHVEAWDDECVAASRWDALPSIVPILEHRQRTLPHLVVVLHEDGADVLVVTDEAPEGTVVVDNSEVSVEARDRMVVPQEPLPLPELVLATARNIDARLVAFTGERARVDAFVERAGSDLAALGRFVPPGRADVVSDAIQAELGRLADSELADLVTSLGAGRNTGTAVVGPASTLEAVRNGTATTIVVCDDPDDATRARFGPSPEEVWADAGDLDDVHDVRSGRLVDVLVRAGVAGRIPVRALGPGAALAGGCAALLETQGS